MLLLVLIPLTGCQTSKNQKSPRVSEDLSYLVKTDIDTVADTHYSRMQAHLYALADKLYKRNPRYCQQSAGIAGCIKSALPDKGRHQLAQRCNNGLACLEAAFEPAEQADRILLLIVGLKQMIDAAYNFKESFYVLDEIDEQKLYNSARNIEIVVWRLKHRLDRNGNPFILSNSTQGEFINLSYERLFGKMISLQDTLAAIMAERNQRLVKNIIQRLATAALLPV